MTIKLETPIHLTVPVAITRDGLAKPVTSLVMTRPKTRHVKQLAVLVGAELIGALMQDSGTSKDVDAAVIAAKALPMLFTVDRLDAALALAADLLGITVDEAGEIDAADLPAVGRGLLDFFPKLQSIVSKNIAQT